MIVSEVRIVSTVSGFDDFSNEAYLLETNGRIDGLSHAFFKLTGFNNEDVVGLSLNDIIILLRLNITVQDLANRKKEDGLYLFTKSYEAVEVILTVTALELNRKIYQFREKLDPRITNKFMFVEQLCSDNVVGVAIHSVPDLILLKTNQKYLDFQNPPNNLIENSIGKTFKERVNGFSGSKAESVFLDIIRTGNSFYPQDFEFEYFYRGTTYWDSSLVPITIDGKVKYIIETVNEVTERVLNKKQSEEHIAELKARGDALLKSELNLSEALHIANMGVWEWDFENREVVWSDETYQIFQIDKASVAGRLGDAITSVVHPDDLHIFKTANAVGITERKPFEYRIIWPDNSIRYIRAKTGKVLFNDLKKPIFLMGVVQDITDQKNMEAELKSQMELFETVIENIPDPFSIYDANEKLVKINAAGRNLYSSHEIYNFDETIQKIDFFDLDGNVISKDKIPFRRALRGEKVNNEIVVIKRKDIERITAVSATPIYDKRNNLVSIASFHRDITETFNNRKQLEEQQNQLLKKEKEINQTLIKTIEMKEEFISLISHELRTPLTVITATLQTLELTCKNELSDRINKYLQKIKQNANRQIKLINNLLDNTRAKSGHFKVNKSNIDIISLSKKIIESILPFVDKKEIQLSFRTDLDSKVIGIDEELYERILLNLLSNAVKFTPGNKGKSIWVIISEMNIENQEMIRIKVEDEGIGIPEEKMDIVFEKFGQVNNVFSRNEEGTGIGLSLVKMIIELMGGKIILESREGFGSTFTVILPAARADSAEENTIGNMTEERILQAAAIEFSDI